jgi:homoserine kinase
MIKKIRVKAPATISNLNCGFDVIGLAINEPFDIIEMELLDSRTIEISGISGCEGLSRDPDKNVVGAVLKAVLEKTDGNTGFRVKIVKGINPGSGIGSSGASSAGAAYAANALLGNRFSLLEMVAFAMEGERMVSGSAHADNVAPALMGGITLVRSYDPLDIIKINIPSDLWCAVLHPDIEVKTSDSRNVLDKEIPLKTAVKQWGNVGGLIAGLYTNDYDLIGRSLKDYVAEPKRASLIPGFFEIKEAALNNGALGAGISGSGPSVFALCRGKAEAMRARMAMDQVLLDSGKKFKSYVSQVNTTGTTTCL